MNNEKIGKDILKSGLLAISKMHVFEYYAPSQASRAKFIKEQIWHMIEGLNVTYQYSIPELEIELMEEDEIYEG